MNSVRIARGCHRRLIAATLLTLGMLAGTAPATADVLYQGIQVSDAGLTGNSIAAGNTSRNLTVGADGTIYAVFRGTNGIRVARSSDRGQTFSASVQVWPTDAEAEISVSSTGIVYVGWVSASRARVSRSLDNGATFSAPVDAGASLSSVHLATDASRVYLIDRLGINFLRSVDNGLSFSQLTPGLTQAFSDVHVDPDNGDVFLQVDNPLVKYYVSTNQGESFGAMTTPTPGGSVYYSVGALSAGPNGRYLFVSGWTLGTDTLRINVDTGASIIPTTFGNNQATQGRSLAADRCGNVVDGFVNASQLQFHVSTDLGATFGPTTTVAAVPVGADQQANVLINQTNGDVLFLYTQSGVVFLSTYEDEVPCYEPQLSTATLTFSAQLLGMTSTAQTVLVTNSGDSALAISAVTATGDFAQTNNCPGTLAIGASCEVSVTFSPTATGTRDGQIQITNDSSPQPRIVKLTGVGVDTAPVPAFTPGTVAFGTRVTGTTGTSVVTLGNVGNQDLVINGFAISSGFSLTENCPATLTPAATCEVTVSFSPSAVIAYSGTLSLDSNAPGAPAAVALSGTGTDQPPEHTVSASVTSGSGTILPASIDVIEGETTAFAVTAALGYGIANVSGCGGSLSGNTYTTGAITGACAVSATFSLNSYTVTATAGSGGSVSPPSATVNHGSTSAFTVTPATGYSIANVSGCSGSLSGNTYTTGAIVGACAVSATFSLNSYTVTATAGSGGSVSPPSATVNHGSTSAFTVTPTAGYSIANVSGCSGSLSGNTYTTGAITGACAVSASFSLNSYTVTATAGAGGSVSPPSATVNHGSTSAFTVTPTAGYSIANVSGCSGSLSGNTYTTGAITGACAVSATFSLNSYTVTATAGAGGTVSPGTTTASHGSTAAFTITPETGYSIANVSGCGGGLSGSTYTTGAITAACAISASFVLRGPTFAPAQPATLDVDATGLLTALPDDFAPPTATDWQGNALEVVLVNGRTHYPPGLHTLTWRAVDGNEVAATVEQTVRIWPTVSLSRDQTIGMEAGNYGSFLITLNGPSPVYPFTVSYTVAGDTQGIDLTSASAAFDADQVELPVYIYVSETAATGSPDREVTVSLDEGVNRGARNSLAITLTSGNSPAEVSVAGAQDGEGRTVFGRSGGAVTLTPDIRDPNLGDSHTVEWVSPGGAVVTVSGGTLSLDPQSLPVGVHRFELRVTDDSAPPQVVSRVVDIVIASDAPALPDGVAQWADNGLPDHPDYSPINPGVLPERERELQRYLIEAEPGLHLARGPHAGLVGLHQAEIASGASTIPADSIANVGGYFDFVVSGLPVAGESIDIVVPQRAAIPAHPVYRKFDSVERRWYTFVEDGNNRLASAPGEPGICPPPASSAYRPGLNSGDWCVRLTLQDGGANDDNGEADGVVADPSGVGALHEIVVTSLADSGGGSMNLLALCALLFALLRRYARPLGLGLLCTLPALAHADDDASRWYAGANIGSASTDVRASDINARLDALGYDAVATIDDDSRTAWRLYGGYRWSPFIAVQAGYTDLGTVDTTFTGQADDIAAFLEDANRIQPHSADGFDLTVFGRYPVLERLALTAQLGGFFWNADYQARDGNGTRVRREDDGFDVLFGAGVEFSLTARTALTAGWSRRDVDEESIDLIELGIQFHWL